MIPGGICVFLTCLAVLPVRAGAEFEPSGWKYVKEIRPPAKVRKSYGIASLDREVFAGSNLSLGDLRVADNSGNEVQYLLMRRAGRTKTVSCPARMTDLGRKGNVTSFVLDLSGRGILHNRITLRTKSKNFRAVARIESSDNRVDWKIIREGAVVFDVTAGYHASHLKITYHDSMARYLRVSIEPDAKPVEITAASVAMVETVPAGEEPREFTVVKSKTEDKSTFWELDFGYENLPVSRIEISAADSNFHRSVTVLVPRLRGTTSLPSKGDVEWRKAGEGTVWRFTTDKFKGEQTHFSIPEIRAGKLRIKVSNYDNPPLKDVKLRVYGIKHEIFFPAGAGARASRRLYYGNAGAKSPRYDLSKTSKYLDKSNADAYSLGNRTANPEYIPPADKRPWTERYPAAFWTVLVLACLVLGWIMVRKAFQISSNP